MQSRKQSKHENKRLLPEQQVKNPKISGTKVPKIPQGQKGNQKRSQSNPAIQSHFQQQKFFSRHQSKRPSVQQSPHLQVVLRGLPHWTVSFNNWLTHIKVRHLVLRSTT